MSSMDDILEGLKSEEDKRQQWHDAAEFFIEIRGNVHGQETDIPLEKDASAKEMLKGMIGKVDPSGLATADNRSRLLGLGAGLIAAGGLAYANRGKPEHGGQSEMEHSLQAAKAKRATEPEPESFAGKASRNLQDFSADFASTARKHPALSALAAGIGGARTGVTIGKSLGFGKGK